MGAIQEVEMVNGKSPLFRSETLDASEVLSEYLQRIGILAVMLVY